MIFTGKHRILGQIAIWGGCWLFIAFIFNNGFEQPERFLRSGLLSLTGIILIIAINLRFLLPKLFFQKKTFLFILSGLLLFIGVGLLLHHEVFPWSDWMNPMDGTRQRGTGMRRRNAPFGIHWMRLMIPFFLAFMGSTLIEIVRFANQKEKAFIQAEKEKLQTEVKFLKSQINPHFLFNVLNNIYGLTLIKSDKASDSLLHLSSLLRYMLYDTNEEKVLLQKEIDYLKNYIHLVRLKDSRGLNIQLDLDESRPNLRVAPLLFIPFVENAVKHSKIEDLKNGKIDIQLITKDNQLEFSVKNSIPKIAIAKDNVGGVGLTNIKQRLELLYPNKHVLTIKEEENLFRAYLKLELT